MGTSTSEKKKRALVLGYDEGRTSIFSTLRSRDFHVSNASESVSSFVEFDLVVSFGYRHLIKGETLRSAPCRVVNIHISYLPYNRGKHPIFWSFFDKTPLGVTIHEIDEGVDTGPIWKRKELQLPNSDMTFREAHGFMIRCAETLFEESLDEILDESKRPFPQEFDTAPHKASDLPEDFRGWDQTIADEILRIRQNI